MNSSSSFFIFGNWIIKNRLLILIFWLLIIIFSLYGAININSVLSGEGSYVKNSESYRQNELIEKYFPEQYTKNIIVTLSSKILKVTDPEFQKSLEIIRDYAKRKKDIALIVDYKTDSSFLSKDNKSTFILLALKDKSLITNNKQAEEFVYEIKSLPKIKDIDIHVTGNAIIINDMTKLSGKDSSEAEKKILPFVIIILLLIFGSLVAALLPILIAFSSIIITLGVLYLVGQYVELTLFCKAITSMMGLGVGIDYSLFMVSRFREELEKGLSKKNASIKTIETAGRSVFYSGIAVSIGMLSLLIPELPLTRSIGISGFIVVFISILLSITLLPIIFFYLGEKINYPKFINKITKISSLSKGFWFKWSNKIMKKPILFSLIGIVSLGFISKYTFDIKLWNSSVLLMPENLDSRKGIETLFKIDPARKFSPIGISFETNDGSKIYEKKNLEVIYNFTKKILENKNIEKVLGIINPNSKVNIEAYQNLYSNNAVLQSIGLVPKNPFFSEDFTKTIIWAIHKDSEISIKDWETVIELRKLRDSYNFTNMNVMIGGGGSTNVDFKNAVYSQFPLIIVIVLIVTYIILFFLMGSLILPLKGIFLNLLSVGASYGWLVLVFQYGITANLIGIKEIPGALLIITPMVLFCIIFGLSMDYEIFMMSRIKEEYENTNDTKLSIAYGLEKSGGIVTSAAFIMIVVFLAFAFSDIILVKEIGLGLSAAIFIDATIIRLILIPSILKILGEFSWWLPEFIKNKIPTVKLEH